jgi:hypothetical protein
MLLFADDKRRLWDWRDALIERLVRLLDTIPRLIAGLGIGLEPGHPPWGRRTDDE